MLLYIIQVHGPLQFAATGFKMEMLFGSFSDICTSCSEPTYSLWLNLRFTKGENTICCHYVQSLPLCISEQESSQGRKHDFKNTKVFEVP